MMTMMIEEEVVVDDDDDERGGCECGAVKELSGVLRVLDHR